MTWLRWAGWLLVAVSAGALAWYAARRVPVLVADLLERVSVRAAASAPLTLFTDRAYVKRWIAILPLALGGAAVAGFLFTPVWGLVGAGAFVALFVQRLAKREDALQETLRIQLPDGIEAVATNAAARASLPEALRDVTSTAQSPLREVFADVLMGYDRGVVFHEALEATAARIRSRELSLAFEIVSVCFRKGSPLDEVSRRLASSVRALQAFRAKIRNETSGVRMGMRIMLILPLGVLAMMASVEKEAVAEMFRNPVGIVLLALAAAFLAWAMIWGRGILRSYL